LCPAPLLRFEENLFISERKEQPKLEERPTSSGVGPGRMKGVFGGSENKKHTWERSVAWR